jgi:hypothetical protein
MAKKGALKQAISELDKKLRAQTLMQTDTVFVQNPFRVELNYTDRITTHFTV